MSLESWATNKWLERLESDREEIERLLANADGHLADYDKAVASGMSADVQLSLAYDAIRASATAALRASGYRVVGAGVNTTVRSRPSSSRLIRRESSSLSSMPYAESETKAPTTTSGLWLRVRPIWRAN
jgi:hypothetical protein